MSGFVSSGNGANRVRLSQSHIVRFTKLTIDENLVNCASMQTRPRFKKVAWTRFLCPGWLYTGVSRYNNPGHKKRVQATMLTTDNPL